MNETVKLISERYSCRKFSDKHIPEEEVQIIAQAAIQAPSAMNIQPWFFAVVTDEQFLADLEEAGMEYITGLPDKSLYERIQSRGGKLFYNTPCAILIAVDTACSSDFEMVDVGIAAENIVLTAASLGISSCHHGLSKFAFQGEKAEEFEKRAQFPEGYKLALAVLLGYSEQPNEPHEPNQNKVVLI